MINSKLPNKKENTIEAYNHSAKDYFLIFSKYKDKKSEIDRALAGNLSANSKVLELGCGPGIDAREIIKKVGANNYFGVDASKELIKLAKSSDKAANFEVADITDQDFWTKAGHFGVIIAYFVFLHLDRESLQQVLDNCYFSLETGGILSILGRYGAYKEHEVTNFGRKKYYYSYTPEQIEVWVSGKYKTLYKTIKDTDYGPSFEILLQKI